MTNEQKAVLEFHKAFNCLWWDKPTQPNLDTMMLRWKLMAEELCEFSEEALNSNRTLEKIADALGDLLYVLLGTAVSLGIDLEPVFAEIHRSNMTKLWTETEAESAAKDLVVTCRRGHSWNKCSCSVMPGERWFIVKRSDSKVVKSPSYERANLSPIIQAQQTK